jgi:hypothetical protein
MVFNTTFNNISVLLVEETWGHREKRQPVASHWQTLSHTVKPVLRGHLWEKEKVAFKDRWPLKRGSIQMKFSMTGHEKGDHIIQVTA